MMIIQIVLPIPSMPSSIIFARLFNLITVPITTRTGAVEPLATRERFIAIATLLFRVFEAVLVFLHYLSLRLVQVSE